MAKLILEDLKQLKALSNSGSSIFETMAREPERVPKGDEIAIFTKRVDTNTRRLKEYVGYIKTLRTKRYEAVSNMRAPPKKSK